MRRLRSAALGLGVLLLAVLAASCATTEALAPPLAGGRLSRAEARAADETYDRGLTAYQGGEYAAALEAFTTVVEHYPASSLSGLALYWQGRTLYQLQREREATQTIERYLALAPDVPFREGAILLLANSHYNQRQFEEALDAALRIDRVSQPRLDDYLSLTRDLVRQLSRPRVEAIAARDPARNFLSPFYLQGARWALAAGDERWAGELARKTLRFTELPSQVLDEARRLAGDLPRDDRLPVSRVGFIAPSEGRFAQVSEEVRRGIELALAEINQGRRTPVELVIRSSAGDADSTAEVIRALARDQQVAAILGPLISEVAVPAGRAASEEGIPLVSPTATDARLLEMGSRVYTVNALDGAIGHTLGTYAVRALNRRRFAILAVDNVYGRIQADAFEAAVNAAGGRVVARRHYPERSTQFTEDLGAFVRNQADAVFIATKSSQEALRVLNQMAFYELHSLMPLGTDAWNDEQFWDQGRRFARGYFADTFSRDPQVTRWGDFVAAYLARYGSEPRNLIPAWGYDATRLALEVLAEAGGTGAAATSPRDHAYRGASGQFRITPGGPRRAVVIHKVEGGQPVAVDW